MCDNAAHGGGDYFGVPGACASKKSSKARRAIMPRLALRPVCTSSRSRERSRRAMRARGRRNIDNGRGGTSGATDRFFRHIVLPGRQAVARLAWGRRHQPCLHILAMKGNGFMVRQKHIFVV
jgi:hypothetical protein